MKNCTALVFLFICVIYSCTEPEPDYVNPYFAEVYPQILDAIDIECEEGESPDFISARINGIDFCHYEDVVPGEFFYNVGISFLTPGPSFNTGETYDDILKGSAIVFGDGSLHHNEYFVITFPNMNLETTIYDFLDSLLAIEYHDVVGSEDVIIPSSAGIVEEGVIKAGRWFKESFLITISSLDKYQDTGGNRFKISSVFGNQDESYLRFLEVRKTEEEGDTFYYMDIAFECNLYHWPQYGYEGLWGTVRDGRVNVKVKVEDRN